MYADASFRVIQRRSDIESDGADGRAPAHACTQSGHPGVVAIVERPTCVHECGNRPAAANDVLELEARDGAATVLEDASQALSSGDGAASQQPAEITPALVEDAPAVEEGAEQA